jgi:PAS domain S-box-containing protein
VFNSGAARADPAYGVALTRELLMMLPVAVAYVSGPDLIIEFANHEYQRLAAGRAAVGRPVREAFPELAGQGRLELLQEVLRSGKSAEGHEIGVSLRRRAEQAEQIFVHFVYEPVRDADGVIAGLLLFAVDGAAHVRDRRGLEELAADLTAAEERYRNLFETLPQGVIYYSAAGDITGANPAAAEILGVDVGEMIASHLEPFEAAVGEDGSRCGPEDFPVTVALRTGEVIADVVLGVPHGRTGEMRWLRITAVPDAWDEDGRPRRAYAMFRDLTEQRRMEAALREGTALLGRLREANVLGVVIADEDRVLDANDAYLEIIGHGRGDLEAGRIDWRRISPPEWAATQEAAMQQLREAGACRPFEKEYVHRAGHRVPVLIGAAVIDRDPLRWASFVVDLSARQRAERERAESLARERAARAEAGSARDRLMFLLRAGNLVAAARDRDGLLQQAAQLVADNLADFGVTFLPGRDGTLQPASAAHRDHRGHDLRRLLPAAGQRAVYWTGATRLIRADGRIARRPAAEEGQGDSRARVLATPLMAGQRTLGVLAAGRSAQQPCFTPTDVAIVEELGRRLGAALDNADASARDHTVAETLQRSILPDVLPEVPGLDLAASYRPATEGASAGGDWYDAFALGDGRLGLVIGDVAGHNMVSASVMSQVRNLIRAYAVDDPHPAGVLRRANTALIRLLPDTVATVAYAVLDPATGDLSYANAGHPPPLLRERPGHAEYLSGAAGIMLGAAPGASFDVGHRRLPPGAVLLFYTDGLIEDRRRDIGEGFDALADAMEMAPAGPARQTCATLTTGLLGSAPRADDVCLLAVRLPP